MAAVDELEVEELSQFILNFKEAIATKSDGMARVRKKKDGI